MGCPHSESLLQSPDGKARGNSEPLGGTMQKHSVIQAVAGGVSLMVLSGAAIAQVQAYTNTPVDV